MVRYQAMSPYKLGGFYSYIDAEAFSDGYLFKRVNSNDKQTYIHALNQGHKS